jgi:hypothetical protein
MKPWHNCMYELFYFYVKLQKYFFCGQNSPSSFSSVSSSFPFKGTHLLPGFGVHKTINDIPAIIICEGVHCQETLSIFAIFFLNCGTTACMNFLFLPKTSQRTFHFKKRFFLWTKPSILIQFRILLFPFPFMGTHLLPGFGILKTFNELLAIIICEGVHCQ